MLIDLQIIKINFVLILHITTKEGLRKIKKITQYCRSKSLGQESWGEGGGNGSNLL